MTAREEIKRWGALLHRVSGKTLSVVDYSPGDGMRRYALVKHKPGEWPDYFGHERILYGCGPREFEAQLFGFVRALQLRDYLDIDFSRED